MAIKDSGDRTQFESGAVRDMHEGKGRFDLLPMCVLMRLAKHYENGAIKYQPRNWEKGIPCHSFADSALRHIVKYLDGWDDEDHLIAAIWNLCGLAWNEEKRPDLMDIPARNALNVRKGVKIGDMGIGGIDTPNGTSVVLYGDKDSEGTGKAKWIYHNSYETNAGKVESYKCSVCGIEVTNRCGLPKRCMMCGHEMVNGGDAE